MADDFDPSTRPSKRRKTYASGRTILDSSPGQSVLSNISGVFSGISDRLLGRANVQKPGEQHDDSAYGSKEDSLNEVDVLVAEEQQTNEEEETKQDSSRVGTRGSRRSSRQSLEMNHLAEVDATKRRTRASQAPREIIRKRISTPANLDMSSEGPPEEAGNRRRSSRRTAWEGAGETLQLHEQSSAKEPRESGTKKSASASRRLQSDAIDGGKNHESPSEQPANVNDEQNVESQPRSSGRTKRQPKRYSIEVDLGESSLAKREANEVEHPSTSQITSTLKSPPPKGILTPSRQKREGPRKSVVFDESGKQIERQLGFKDIGTSNKKGRTGKKSDPVKPSKHDEIPETPQQDFVDEADIFLDRNPPQDILQSLELPPSPSTFSLAREDSPQIINIKSLILSRLTSISPPLPPPPHLTSAFNTLHSLLASAITSSESNSLLLLGSRGSGKTHLVNSALADLTAKHPQDFHVVRLNGFFQTDDRLALREIWRQLGRERQGEVEEDEAREIEGGSYAETMASLLSLLSHPDEFEEPPPHAEIMDLDDPNPTPASTRTSKSIIIILDEFDLFTLHPRQTLLYNLFDIAQSKKAPIAVVGCSARMDVIECLEKRVKSRFSHRWVHVPGCRSVEGFREVLEGVLCVDARAVEVTDENEVKERQRWNDYIKSSFLPSTRIQSLLNSTFHTTKSLPSLLAALYIPIATLRIPSTDSTAAATATTTPTASTTSLPPSSSIKAKPKTDSKAKSKSKSISQTKSDRQTTSISAATSQPDPSTTLSPITLPSTQPPSITSLLPSLPTLHLSLLISAARLETLYALPQLNFNATYTHYLDLLSRSKQRFGGGAEGSSGMRAWSRETCLSAWEDLCRWEVLLPATGKAEDEYLGGREEVSVRMVRVDVTLEDLSWAVGWKFTGGTVVSGEAGGMGKGLAEVLGRWCREE